MFRRRLAALVAALAFAAVTPGFAQDKAPPPGTAIAIFAGGCFWCMEPPFDKLDGVLSTTSGYTGGPGANPTYQQVSAGGTGHIEALKIEYDPTKVTYAKLLDTFWRNIDPLDGIGQFCDKGPHYLSAIFVLDDAQRTAAEASKIAIQPALKVQGTIVTKILPASAFWPAEDYHQDYYKKSPVKYSYYRWGCGRDARLEKLWGPAPTN